MHIVDIRLLFGNTLERCCKYLVQNSSLQSFAHGNWLLTSAGVPVEAVKIRHHLSDLGFAGQRGWRVSTEYFRNEVNLSTLLTLRLCVIFALLPSRDVSGWNLMTTGL